MFSTGFPFFRPACGLDSKIWENLFDSSREARRRFASRSFQLRSNALERNRTLHVQYRFPIFSSRLRVGLKNMGEPFRFLTRSAQTLRFSVISTSFKCPREESNLYYKFRKLASYPLNDEGFNICACQDSNLE